MEDCGFFKVINRDYIILVFSMALTNITLKTSNHWNIIGRQWIIEQQFAQVTFTLGFKILV